MNKYFLTFLFFILASSIYSIEGFLLGTQVHSDNSNLENLNSLETPYASIYWELYAKNFGFGMTYSFSGHKEEAFMDKVEYDWFLYWESTIDMKYHLLGTSNWIDPFTEISLGVRANNQLWYYSKYISNWEKDSDGNYIYNYSGDSISGQTFQNIHLIGRLNAGINFNFDNYFIGGKLGINLLDNDVFNYLDEKLDILKAYRLSVLIGYKF